MAYVQHAGTKTEPRFQIPGFLSEICGEKGKQTLSRLYDNEKPSLISVDKRALHGSKNTSYYTGETRSWEFPWALGYLWDPLPSINKRLSWFQWQAHENARCVPGEMTSPIFVRKAENRDGWRGQKWSVCGFWRQVINGKGASTKSYERESRKFSIGKHLTFKLIRELGE